MDFLDLHLRENQRRGQHFLLPPRDSVLSRNAINKDRDIGALRSDLRRSEAPIAVKAAPQSFTQALTYVPAAVVP